MANSKKEREDIGAVIYNMGREDIGIKRKNSINNKIIMIIKIQQLKERQPQ